MVSREREIVSDCLIDENCNSEGDVNRFNLATIVSAYISAESSSIGKTPIKIEDSDEPFNQREALSMYKFSKDDIGMKVACLPLIDGNGLVIVGVMPEKNRQKLCHNESALDKVLESTQLNAAKFMSESPSKIAQDDKSLEAIIASEKDDVEIFSQQFIKPAPNNKLKIIADGKEAENLVIRAEGAITLQCGQSSICLTADGRVRINGHYIHSKATHTQQISGGSVKIN